MKYTGTNKNKQLLELKQQFFESQSCSQLA